MKPKQPLSRGDTATTAKERLQVIIAHERLLNKGYDFLPKMQRELIEVIRKYVDIDPDDVRIDMEQEGDCHIMEVNISLPDRDQ